MSHSELSSLDGTNNSSSFDLIDKAAGRIQASYGADIYGLRDMVVDFRLNRAHFLFPREHADSLPLTEEVVEARLVHVRSDFTILDRLSFPEGEGYIVALRRCIMVFLTYLCVRFITCRGSSIVQEALAVCHGVMRGVCAGWANSREVICIFYMLLG